MKLFFQKNAILLSAGGSAPRPRDFGGWGFAPRPQNTTSPLRISGYAPGPAQFNFANQFNCIIRMNLKVFVLNFATIDPFYERNVTTTW